MSVYAVFIHKLRIFNDITDEREHDAEEPFGSGQWHMPAGLDGEWALYLSIRRHLDEDGVVTVSQVVADTGVDARTVRKRLNGLVENGHLIIQGKTRGRRYLRR